MKPSTPVGGPILTWRNAAIVLILVIGYLVPVFKQSWIMGVISICFLLVMGFIIWIITCLGLKIQYALLGLLVLVLVFLGWVMATGFPLIKF